MLPLHPRSEFSGRLVIVADCLPSAPSTNPMVGTLTKVGETVAPPRARLKRAANTAPESGERKEVSAGARGRGPFPGALALVFAIGATGAAAG